MYRDRAWRRFQKEKKKEKIKNFCDCTDCSNRNDREIGKRATTPKPCSCYMCGNPRKYFGEVSIPEKRFIEEYEKFNWN